MERKSLGKGLGALIPGAEREDRLSGTELDVRRISVNPYQPRETFNDDKFQELVSSVRVHGVLQPIVVRSKGEGDYELVAGERRLRAAIAAGLARIPAVVRELTDEQSLQVALIENLQREDINPVEAAAAYRRLGEEFGLSQEEMAFTLGKSRSAIANTMRILTLPDEILECVRSRRISEGHARAILSLDNEDQRIELCRRIAAGGLSVRDTERMARQWAGGKPNPIAAGRDVSRETGSVTASDPNTLELEQRLRETFGTRVRIIRHKDRGRIEIEFYSDDDMERILSMITGS